MSSPPRYELPQFACEANWQFDVSDASPENLTTILKSGDIMGDKVVRWSRKCHKFSDAGEQLVSQFWHNLDTAIILDPKQWCRKPAIKVSVHCDTNASRKFTQKKT